MDKEHVVECSMVYEVNKGSIVMKDVHAQNDKN